MAPPPPRPAASRQGGPASSGASPSSSSRAKDEKQPPQTFFLGRYRVVDEIGVGGMASVHLGRMDGPGGFQKWVAIKRIHPHLVEDDQFVDMFLDEARIAAGINHANVAQVFDLGKDDNTYWIAMEYLHGEPLRELMRRAEERGGRISPELAARICADAAEGLHAAHELRGKNGQLLGLVHRDVTPHNLFVTYDGYTKVVDFGIAKVADRLSSTRAGTLKGKLAYMSPEQVRGAEVDRTTDIFALGVVLWEITTNQRLFRMDTDLDTLEKVQACIVTPPSQIVPGYPPALEAVVMKALSKRKQDRYQTGREFSRGLQQYLMQSGHFVGPEEVAQFIRAVFADRIQKRDAHLAYFAEVTSNHNLAEIRAKAGAPAEDPVSSGRGRPAPSATPASGERPRPQPLPQPAAAQPIANQSLMDDDEDVPTTVAAREQLEPLLRSAGVLPPAGGRPPAQPGGPSAASYAANASRAPSPSFNANAAAAPAYATSLPATDEGFGSTVAMPSSVAMAALSPNATMALPSEAFNPPSPAAKPAPAPGPAAGMGQQFGGGGQQFGGGGGQQFGGGGPQFGGGGGQQFGGGGGQQFGGGGGQQFGGGAPPPGTNGPGFGFQQGGPAPSFGQQANPQLTPAGMVGGVPMHLPAMPAGGPQSQIETALSLPRPDPAALLAAQQDREKDERRNLGVIIAVIALTVLCVVGICTIVYLKLKARTHAGTPPDTAAAVTASTGTAATGDTATATAAPAATSAAAAASPSPSATATATTRAAAAAGTAQASGSAKATKDDPGFLTIVCSPGCDDVSDQGRSLGPPPIVHLSVAPGTHRITGRRGKDTKTISVNVTSGQVTTGTVPMK